nr:hypothetical protein [Candidatus Sigynarchaeum springense]
MITMRDPPHLSFAREFKKNEVIKVEFESSLIPGGIKHTRRAFATRCPPWACF